MKTIVLTSVTGGNLVSIVKIIKHFLNNDLKQSKDLMNLLQYDNATRVPLGTFHSNTAEEFKKELEKAGAKALLEKIV